MSTARMSNRVKDMFAQADDDLKKPGRNLAIHPFVTGVADGKLNKAQIKAWSEQTYLYVTDVIPHIAVAYSNCENPDIREHIWNNLYEEKTGNLSGTKPHPELMADFAIAVGANRKALDTNKPLYATRALMNHWELNLRHRHYSVGMAGMGFGGERQIPVTFRKVTDGLAKHYKLDEKARLFFDMHMKADEDHGDEVIEVVSLANPDDATLNRVYNCIIDTAECMWNCWMSFESAPAH